MIRQQEEVRTFRFVTDIKRVFLSKPNHKVGLLCCPRYYSFMSYRKQGKLNSNSLLYLVVLLMYHLLAYIRRQNQVIKHQFRSNTSLKRVPYCEQRLITRHDIVSQQSHLFLSYKTHTKGYQISNDLLTGSIHIHRAEKIKPFK